MSPCLGLFSPLHSPVADQRVCEFTEVCYVTVPSQLWSTTPLSQGEGLIFPPAPRGAFRRHPPGVTSFISGLFNQVCPFTEDCSPFASKRLFFLLSLFPLRMCLSWRTWLLWSCLTGMCLLTSRSFFQFSPIVHLAQQIQPEAGGEVICS